MLKAKTCMVVPILAAVLTVFAWPGRAAEEVPAGKGPGSASLQASPQAPTTELEQARKDLDTSKQRIDALEKSLAATERQVTELQRQNLSLQDASDMAREDVGLMRAEMQRCTGDRAHLDELTTRYQASQTQLYELRQYLREVEMSIAAITRDRDNLKAGYDQLRMHLDVPQDPIRPPNSQRMQNSPNTP